MKDFILLIIPIFLACNSETQSRLLIDSRIMLLSGEVTHSSIILQSRFNATDSLVDYDIPGIQAGGYFQISKDSGFSKVQETSWHQANIRNDYIISAKVDQLNEGTQYFYRVKGLINNIKDTIYSSTGQFQTLPAPWLSRASSFAISTGFNYEKFYGTDLDKGSASKGAPAIGIDRELGFEAFEAVQSLSPDFFIANGDVVYYDKPGNQPELWARDHESMRAKWHRYFAMPRNRWLCQNTPVFYLKDDHDHRFNDCDATNTKFSEPSHQLGIQVFKEQLPVAYPKNHSTKTYRTVRAGKLLQLWLVEGRDYRSPNTSDDTSQKTIWGEEQKAWFKQTMLENDATFKLLISPTPMIGPDDGYKKDNHTNIGGFQAEQKEIFTWLLDHNFLDKNFYIICGDRHWQYHSIHPNGLEEFSSGAFVNQNSRAGRQPGDPDSTDPDATIATPFIQIEEVGGGFLLVTANIEESTSTLTLSFRDTQGQERYSVKKVVL